MKQNHSWDANWFSASQEIPWILWKPEFHFGFHKCVPFVPTLNFSVNNWNRETFICWRAVGTLPNPQAGGITCVGYLWSLIQYIHCHPSSWRLFVHPNIRMCHAVVTSSHLSHSIRHLTLLPETATETTSEGHSYMTQSVENCRQIYKCNNNIRLIYHKPHWE